jgi:hypothetical protein
MTSYTLPRTVPTRTHSLRDPAYLAFALLRTAFTVAPIVFGLDKSSTCRLIGMATSRRWSTVWCPAPGIRRCWW